MRKMLAAMLLLAALLSACKGEKTEAPEVETIDTIPTMVIQIRQCSKLYTAECKVRKIVTHKDEKSIKGKLMNQAFSISLPMSERRVAIPIDATVKAYIDFSGFSEKNVRREGEKVEITLPDPKLSLTATKIDHEGIKRHVALMRSNFSDEELTQYTREGREAVLKDIPGLGIVATARDNAAAVLIPIVEQMGFKRENITVTFREDFSPSDIRKLLDTTKEAKQ